MGWVRQASLPTLVRDEDVLCLHICALFIEPLAAAIRQKEKIRGIKKTTTEHKTVLYADDVLLLLQDPQSSLPELFTVINSFSKFPTTMWIV